MILKKLKEFFPCRVEPLLDRERISLRSIRKFFPYQVDKSSNGAFCQLDKEILSLSIWHIFEFFPLKGLDFSKFCWQAKFSLNIRECSFPQSGLSDRSGKRKVLSCKRKLGLLGIYLFPALQNIYSHGVLWLLSCAIPSWKHSLF